MPDATDFVHIFLAETLTYISITTYSAVTSRSVYTYLYIFSLHDILANQQCCYFKKCNLNNLLTPAALKTLSY